MRTHLPHPDQRQRFVGSTTHNPPRTWVTRCGQVLSVVSDRDKRAKTDKRATCRTCLSSVERDDVLGEERHFDKPIRPHFTVIIGDKSA